MLVMKPEESILEEFARDVHDTLETLECDLLELEKGEGNSSELIDDIFALFYSIKGASAYVGLTNLSNLTHSAEDILSLMRTSEIQAKPRFIDPLFQVVDAIRFMLDDLENSNEMNISPLLSRLDTILREEASAGREGKPPDSISLNDLLKVFPDFGKRIFESNTLPGRNSGTIIKGKAYFPSSGPLSGFPNGKVPYDVLFATELDSEAMGKKLGLSNKQIFRIEKRSRQT